MEATPQQIWTQLQERALRSLEEGRWPLWLSTRPTFENWHAIGLGRCKVSAPGERRRYGWEVCWRFWRLMDDSRRLDTLEERPTESGALAPTIETRRARVDDDVLPELLSSLRRIVVPVLPPDSPGGLDGTDFELSARIGTDAVRFSWWSEHHPEWQPLVTWFGLAWWRLADHFDVGNDAWPEELHGKGGDRGA